MTLVIERLDGDLRGCFDPGTTRQRDSLRIRRAPIFLDVFDNQLRSRGRGSQKARSTRIIQGIGHIATKRDVEPEMDPLPDAK